MSKKEKRSPGDEKTARYVRSNEVVIGQAPATRTPSVLSDAIFGFGIPEPIADEVAVLNLNSGRFVTTRVIDCAFKPSGRRWKGYQTVVGVSIS